MKIVSAMACALVLISATAQASVVDDRLKAYQAEGATDFSAARGEKMWKQKQTHSKSKGKERSCTTCHSADLTTIGKHAKTGKAIDPLAPSANSERLTDTKKIEKWFKRNCKWTLGRECSAQEKGDFLSYISQQ